MKKNNKGFMLAETIVTTVVIVSAMIGLYSIFNRLYNQYNKYNSYYNIDGKYAIINTVDYLLINDFNGMINTIFENKQFFTIMKKEGDICSKYNNIDITNFLNQDTCKTIRDTYNINEMIIAEYDASVLEKDIKNDNMNQTFKEYIDYVIGYYDVSNDDTKFSYIVLVEIKDGDDYYYANMGIE